MRVRIRVTIDEADSFCRLLRAYSDWIKDSIWFKYETVLDDYYRLERKLRLTSKTNGKKKISFTLDGLTIIDIHNGFFTPQDNTVRQCLKNNFDEANIYIIMWAVEEVMKSVSQVRI